ncbi:reverse transcriptase-like protein [Candidatus Dojkabacteria bacterium]|nr:reverse transcriptase-like protein [Candidatus Dojkabacteria bacterium]
MADSNPTYNLFTDGGARGNPGPAGIGAILFDENDKLVWFDSEYIGESTNNEAEYKAILEGLTYFKKFFGSKKITLKCYLDSELIVKQLNGEYKVKNENLKMSYNEIQSLINDLDLTFEHVYREKNKFADKLVNISLDAHGNS